MIYDNEIITGDCLETLRGLPDKIFQSCITSPPYWGLRDYGVDGQLGLESTPEEYTAKMVEIFREVRRTLRDDGTLWLNLGDGYLSQQGKGFNGQRRLDDANLNIKVKRPPYLKPKDLCGIPWMIAFALRNDGWYLRCDIIWSKPNPMPESVTDRPTKAHEYIFLMSKNQKYYYNADAIKEPAQDWGSRDRSNWSARVNAKKYGQKPHTGGENGNFAETGRNSRSVWEIPTQPFTGWERTSLLCRAEGHVFSGDMKRIMSPNCPIHGDFLGLVARALYDEHEENQTDHIEHIGNCLAQEQPADCEPSETLRTYCFGAESLDSILPSSLFSAICRNIQNHKKDHAPETNFSYRPSSEIIGDTLRILASRGLSDQEMSIFESNTWPVEMDARLLGKTLYRTVDKFSLISPYCHCPIYEVKVKETSHFATYPQALVNKCILAGTKEGDLILDPFAGSGTTGYRAKELRRKFLMIELNPEYVKLIHKRVQQEVFLLETEKA